MQIFQAVFLDSERLKIVDMEFEIILTNVFLWYGKGDCSEIKSLEISDKQMTGSSTFRYMSFEKFGQYFRSCKEKFIKVLRDMLFKKGTVSFNLERGIEKIFFTVIIVKMSLEEN